MVTTGKLVLLVAAFLVCSHVDADENKLSWSLLAHWDQTTEVDYSSFASTADRNHFQDFADAEDFAVNGDKKATWPLDLVEDAISDDDYIYNGGRHLKKKGKAVKAPTAAKAPIVGKAPKKGRRHLKKNTKKNAKAPTTPKTPTTSKVPKKRNRI